MAAQEGGEGSHATPCLGCRGCGREWRPRKPWWEEGTTHTVVDMCIVQGIMILSISRGRDCNQIKVAEIDGKNDLSRRFQHASMLMVTTRKLIVTVEQIGSMGGLVGGGWKWLWCSR